MNLLFVIFGIVVALAVVVVLARIYELDARDLPEYEDHRSMTRHGSTLDALGCASGHHKWVPATQTHPSGVRVYTCTVCDSREHRIEVA